MAKQLPVQPKSADRSAVKPTVRAALCYVPVIGLIGLTARLPLVRFHAVQAALLGVMSLGVGLVWALGGWILAVFVPYVGAILAAAGFAALLAFWVVVLLNSLSGAYQALKGQTRPVLLLERWLS